ncbi:MAG TPA: hypothetical protein VHE12_00445 [bacterium]|nr:hypothetical protein [bacterium]
MKTFWISLFTFVAGMALGVFVHGVVEIRHFREVRVNMHNPNSVLDNLSRRLDLSDDQQQKVLVLLKAQIPKTDALRDEQRKKFKAIRTAFDAQLRPLLNADQQKRLDAMVADWDRHEKAETRDPDCPSGPVSAAVAPR